VDDTDEADDGLDESDTTEQSPEEDDTDATEESEDKDDSIEVEAGTDDGEAGQDVLGGFGDENGSDVSEEEEDANGIEADPDMGIDIGGSSEDYTLDLTEEQWETLVEALGSTKTRPLRRFAIEIFDKMNVLRSLP